MNDNSPIYKEIFIPITSDADDAKITSDNERDNLEYFESNSFNTNSVNKFSYHYIWNKKDNLDEGIVIFFKNVFFKDENTYNIKKDSFTSYYRKIK